MNYDYVIRLRRPNYRAVDMISQLLLLLYLAAALRSAYTQFQLSGSWINFAFPVIIVVLWIMNLSRVKNNIVFYRLPLLIAALGWIMIAHGWSWMTLVYGILALIEPQVKFPDEIGFTTEKIVRNTFPKRSYEWVEVDAVMIRNNLFTMDLRNNKLIQKELESPVSPALQDEFNTYCFQQLHFKPEGAESDEV